MRVGLTLGKYAPLHHGHQSVIETALREMDHVIVLIYDVPDTTQVPLPVRAKWIRRLYPTVEVLESWDGPIEVGLEPDIVRRHDEYLIARMAGRGVTHFYSSEPYGEHVSRALGAIDRRVDQARREIPISATQIRDQWDEYRTFVHPIVLRDLLTHIVFLGAPSTGKTTLCTELARELGTVWVPEYGREYWQKHQVDRRLTLEQLWEIGAGHREREERAMLEANRYLIVDTDASTTRHFSMFYHDRCDARLEVWADETATRYDLHFLCMPDIPYEDTWDRSGAVFREVFQRRIEADLVARGVRYVPLWGTIEARIARVMQELQKFQKYARCR